MREWLLAGLLLTTAGPALPAEIVSAGPDSITATFYQSYGGYPDVALIVEKRTVSLPAGDGVVRFDGVASSMVPQTARLAGLPSSPRESDFDYDLFDSATVLAKSIGHDVELVQSPPKSPELHRTGTLAGEQGVLALKDGAGVEAIGCGGPPARLVMPMPPGLRSKPALSVHLHVAETSRRTLTVSYLADHVRWRAVYIATVARDRRHVALEGRIALDNRTDTGFHRVAGRFVAGELSRLRETAAPKVAATAVQRQCWPLGRTSDPVLPPAILEAGASTLNTTAAPAPAAALARRVMLENLGDLKLYRLEEPITVAALQQKLFSFLTAASVRAEPVFVVPIQPATRQGEAARPVWRLQNDRASGLGRPLPHGLVTLYDSGHAFLGEDSLPADLAVGSDFTLAGTPGDGVLFDDRVVAAGTESAHLVRSHELVVKNRTGQAATIEVHVPMTTPNQRVSGLDGGVAKDGAFVWTTTLAGAATRRITFTVRDEG